MAAMAQDRVVAVAARLIAAHDADLDKDGRLGKVRRYLKGDHDLPYAPRGARQEYLTLARKAITNWLPLVSDTFAKGLFVDGYRPAKSKDNAKAWDYWQANRLDARQTIVHRGALDYGHAYAYVLPGDSAPVISLMTALKVRAMYRDDDDEWPVYALVFRGRAEDGSRLFEFVDDTAVHYLREQKRERDKGTDLVYVTAAFHELGKCPIVRFRHRLDGEAEGIVRPLVNIQDRVNEAVFSLMIAIQYASFRQRWATGLAVPLDEDQYLDANGNPTQAATDASGTANRANPNYGKPVEPFQAAVDRLWVSDNPDARFGDFSQTDVTGHLKSYDSAVRTLAAIAETPPHVLLGDLVNLSADALAAAEASTQRKIGEFETIFGESWEQTFRLAALAAGDEAGAADTSAQVRWRDTEARSLAQTVDALGKMAQMLQVPVTELWERIPGVTETDVNRWREAAGKADGMAALAAALTAHSQANPAAPAPAPAGGAATGGATVAPSGA